MNGRGFTFSAKLTSCFSLSCALSLLLMTHDKEHIAFFYDDWSKSTFEQQVIFGLSQYHLSCGLACRLVTDNDKRQCIGSANSDWSKSTGKCL